MRARNIKPGFFKNEVLGSADPLLSILFEGLWCMADREGRLEDRPLRLCAEIFPYRRQVTEKKCDRMLQWLNDQNFMHRYAVNGCRYIQINSFLKHQRPHANERPSEIPALTSLQALPNSPLNEPQVASDSDKGDKRFALNPDSGFLIPDSLIPDPPAMPAETKKTTDVAEDSETDSEVGGESNPKNDEAWRMWQRVEAAIVVTDLQTSFPADSKTVKTIGLIGGWRKLGQRSRDQRGQTKQQFLTTYRSLP